MRKWLLILGCMIIIGGGTAYYFLRTPYKENTASAAQARSVQASEGSLQVKVSGTGAVAAADTATVKAGYQGTIGKVLAAVGDTVKKGQTLAEFEGVDNSLAIRQKELDKRKQELQILDLKQQYGAESDETKLAQIKLELDTARLSVQQADADITSLQQGQSQSRLISSPIDGTLTSLALTAGDNVNAGVEAAVVTDYSKLTFAVNADELDVPKLKVGQSAQIILNALPEKSFDGKITTIAKEGSSSNGVAAYPVTLSITAPQGILAGMSGSAEIVTAVAENAVLVPIDAVVTMGGKSYVRVPEGTEGAVSGWQGGFGSQNGAGAPGVGGGMSGGSSQAASGGTAPGGAAGQEGQPGEGNAGTGSGGRWSGGSGGERTGAGGAQSARNGAGSGSQVQGTAGSESRMSRMALGGQLKEVTTGLANETYVQIKSGLAVGDAVLIALPTGTVGGSTGQSSTRSQFGMGGGFGGGGIGGGFAGGGFGGNGGVRAAGGGSR